ncbi:MAG: SRPBCC family protein [Desulfobacterales bacterium]|nr:SRPBCC family protein [Desulfobacterales bacterium]
MVKFNESILISQSVDKVFEFTANPVNIVHWQKDTHSAELTSEGAFGMDSTYTCINLFMDQEFETEGVIIEFEPGVKCSYKFSTGPVDCHSSFMFEETPEGTKFTAVGKAKVGMLKFLMPTIGEKIREKLKRDMASLKALLESAS